MSFPWKARGEILAPGTPDSTSAPWGAYFQQRNCQDKAQKCGKCGTSWIEDRALVCSAGAETRGSIVAPFDLSGGLARDSVFSQIVKVP